MQNLRILNELLVFFGLLEGVLRLAPRLLLVVRVAILGALLGLWVLLFPDRYVNAVYVVDVLYLLVVPRLPGLAQGTNTHFQRPDLVSVHAFAVEPFQVAQLLVDALLVLLKYLAQLLLALLFVLLYLFLQLLFGGVLLLEVVDHFIDLDLVVKYDLHLVHLLGEPDKLSLGGRLLQSIVYYQRA